MNETAIAAVVSRIRFRDWTFLIGPMGDGAYLQPIFGDPTQEPSLQTGRKWYVSQHAVPEEVVQTALKAVLTAIEHEAREAFLVDGRAIYGPHFSLDALIAAADRHGEVRRHEGSVAPQLVGASTDDVSVPCYQQAIETPVRVAERSPAPGRSEACGSILAGLLWPCERRPGHDGPHAVWVDSDNASWVWSGNTVPTPAAVADDIQELL